MVGGTRLPDRRVGRTPRALCFVAIDEVTGEAEALIEFFYGYPGEQRAAPLEHCLASVTTSWVGACSSSAPHGTLRCVDRCCPSTRHTRRSDTSSTSRT